LRPQACLLRQAEHRVATTATTLHVEEPENLYVGDQQTWHFNTMSAWRIREPETLIVGWTWPNASELVQRACLVLVSCG